MKKFFGKLANKWLLKGTTTIILVAIVIACYVGVNWGISQLRIEEIDLTTDKLYSLSDETKNKLNELNNDITIQLINMRDYMSNYVDGNYVIDYAQKYRNASDKVTIEEINDITQRVDLQTKYGITTSDAVIIVKNGEKEELLTESDLYTVDYASYEAVDKTEEAITNAIMRATLEDKPKIYVYTGKTYYAPEQVLSVILYQLTDEANEVNPLDILSVGNVPEDCDCLVMTTLKQDLSDLERDKILEYINRGGKILMLSSQNTLEVDTPNFDQVLSQYGISMDYGIIFEQDSSRMLADAPTIIVAEANASYMEDVDMTLKMCMVGAGKINFADEAKLKELGVTYETIASTSDKAFVRTDFNANSSSRTDKDSEEGTFTIASYVTKTISEGVSSELIIFANEIMATNLQTPINAQYYIYPIVERNNQDVVLNSISNLTEREDTIIVRKAYDVDKYSVTDQEDVIIQTIIFALPFVIIIIGIGVSIYRKRRI